MGLFSLMAPKKSAPSNSSAPLSKNESGVGRFDHDSQGKIVSRELPGIHRRLIDKIGRAKAERVMEQLQANMDTDGAFGARNVSSREVDQIIHTLEKSHYNDLDREELDKARGVLKGYE